MIKRQIALYLLMIFTTAIFADGPDYPVIYRDLGLPQYQNADVTSVGRDNTSLRDGIRVTLLTQDDDATIRAYYEAEMQDRGWVLEETIASKNMRAAGLLDKMPFTATFNKDDMRYRASSNRGEHGTVIQINLLEE